MDASALKTMTGDELDTAGAELKLDRVSRAHGHGFDETDDSYRRRLLAELVGPVAADAMSQPADIVGAPAPAPGPTVGEWVAAGFRAKFYPPKGFESRSTADEIAAAIAEQDAADEKAMTEATEAAEKAAADKAKIDAENKSAEADAAAMAAQAAADQDKAAATAAADAASAAAAPAGAADGVAAASETAPVDADAAPASGTAQLP